MSFKNRSGFVLLALGIVTMPLVRFWPEFFLVSLLLLSFGVVRVTKELGVRDRLMGFISSNRRPPETPSGKAPPPRIDPLLPVRVLKLAESRGGVVSVSAVAMALNVGLDECQLALDELVRKGAANVDVDFATGIANYSFPEFLPHTIEGAGPL
jgi:hypothetical protein